MGIIQWFLFDVTTRSLSMILNKCIIQWFSIDVTTRSHSG